MWQQAALPHPPLPVSHGCPDDTCWQGWEMAAKETPKWTLPPHSQHTLTLTHTHTPSTTGFCHKYKRRGRQWGRGRARGAVVGGVKAGGNAVEMQKSGTGYKKKSNIKPKAHNSPISYQSNLWYHLFCSSF